MLDKIRIITFKNQYPGTSIQHLFHKGNTMCKKITIKGLTRIKMNGN
jgi:hypothetical protein